MAVRRSLTDGLKISIIDASHRLGLHKAAWSLQGLLGVLGVMLDYSGCWDTGITRVSGNPGVGGPERPLGSPGGLAGSDNRCQRHPVPPGQGRVNVYRRVNTP